MPNIATVLKHRLNEGIIKHKFVLSIYILDFRTANNYWHKIAITITIHIIAIAVAVAITIAIDITITINDAVTA